MAEESLTPKEVETLRLVSIGKTNNEIAKLEHIEPITVKYRMTNIMSKLAVVNRTGAVWEGMKRGIIPLPVENNGSVYIKVFIRDIEYKGWVYESRS